MRAATGFEPSDKWFGQQAVYRVSMGNFLFFASMSLALLGVKYKGDKRGQVLQHGNWMIKLVVWVLFMALPFLFPNGLVQAYGEQMPGVLGAEASAVVSYASDLGLASSQQCGVLRQQKVGVAACIFLDSIRCLASSLKFVLMVQRWPHVCFGRARVP